MLVRRAFVQTEEQQLQFEQILRHEYGRRSKGEVPQSAGLPLSHVTPPPSPRSWPRSWRRSCRCWRTTRTPSTSPSTLWWVGPPPAPRTPLTPPLPHLQTRNGYDQWLHAEKQRIRGLIDKFWHFSLPRPQLWRHYNPTDYHRAFSILLQRIVGWAPVAGQGRCSGQWVM